ncbi:MAG: preprotein translocase subunit SecE [Gammaproteobacteria bacterium]|jgi:preprotein translocase subunit SecE|nr:preprotein translocase subunit SecE [Gammaproteobacteria bacterium]MDH3506711.1 preprotein translocase subunit SecE [Gammaproteobacteria bacterium]
MDTKADTGSTSLDTLKLAVAAAVLLGGLVAYYYYVDVATVIRALGVLVAFGLSVVILLQSTQGKALWRFINASRVELRKVVWPTRDEAIQTTIAVFVFTLIMGVFFWLLDMFLLWLTRLLTGQGG